MSLTSCLSGVFIVNFEHILHFYLVLLLLTLNKKILAGNELHEALPIITVGIAAVIFPVRI